MMRIRSREAAAQREVAGAAANLKTASQQRRAQVPFNRFLR
jgi:hypothetical protein